LTAGKPFINNFFPTFGDMLRLNMAVPATPRNSPDFSSLGIVSAAVLGLTDPRFNTTATLENIPNMDGFPNGRRLEDDVTRIELQAVSGIALAAIGLFYDDYTIGGNPVTAQLGNVLGYSTGIEENDTNFRFTFPYVQLPWSGYDLCTGGYVLTSINPKGGINVGAPQLLMESFPNPANDQVTIRYRVASKTRVSMKVYDTTGRIVAAPLNNALRESGIYDLKLPTSAMKPGVYFITLLNNNQTVQSIKTTIAR
jgi:hypothetical protein